MSLHFLHGQNNELWQARAHLNASQYKRCLRSSDGSIFQGTSEANREMDPKHNKCSLWILRIYLKLLFLLELFLLKISSKFNSFFSNKNAKDLIVPYDDKTGTCRRFCNNT